MSARSITLGLALLLLAVPPALANSGQPGRGDFSTRLSELQKQFSSNLNPDTSRQNSGSSTQAPPDPEQLKQAAISTYAANAAGLLGGGRPVTVTAYAYPDTAAATGQPRTFTQSAAPAYSHLNTDALANYQNRLTALQQNSPGVQPPSYNSALLARSQGHLNMIANQAGPAVQEAFARSRQAETCRQQGSDSRQTNGQGRSNDCPR